MAGISAELEQELELEGESEFELEGEGELEGEFELEGEGEFEGELEGEFEGEGEGEGEFEHEQGEQFWGAIGSALKTAGRWAAPRVGKAVGSAAGGWAGQRLGNWAGSALGSRLGLPGVGGAAGGWLGRQGGSHLGGMLGQRAGQWAADRWLQELESELGGPAQEFEHESYELGEHESYELGEHEALGELMASYAAEATNELQAEAMMGAASTLTLGARDRAALRRLVPHLTNGAALLTRVLRSRPETRPAVRVVPTIVKRTARSLRRAAASGQPITRRRAALTMSRETRRVLGSPRTCGSIVRRNIRATRGSARTRQRFA